MLRPSTAPNGHGGANTYQVAGSAQGDGWEMGNAAPLWHHAKNVLEEHQDLRQDLRRHGRWSDARRPLWRLDAASPENAPLAKQ
jgi:hypothetical protein